MVIEHAILNVRPGESPAFLASLKEALPLISATPGFLGLEVRACIEVPNRYVLLVQWETLEAHTEGFRGSERYHEWRARLHHFYEPFPLVEHYGDPVVKA